MSAPQMPCKLVVLVSGNGSNLQAIINQIDAGQLDARIAGVISDKPDAYGIQRAARHEIPTTILVANNDESRESYDMRLQTAIDSFQPDWIIMAGFMRILSDALVEQYLGRLINIHPSLLPKFKGLNTHQRALQAGEAQHGASVHFVTPKLDDGPVIMQGRIAVHPHESADELKQRVHRIEHQIYPNVVQLLCHQRISYRDGHVLFDDKLAGQPLTPTVQVAEN